MYDGWVFVKGAGILDTRLFVEPAAGNRPSQETTATSVPDPTGEDGGGISTVGYIAIAAVIGAAMLAMGVFMSGRRPAEVNRRSQRYVADVATYM